MLRIFDLIAQVAPSRSTVLIQGESGTGKEVVAEGDPPLFPEERSTFVPVKLAHAWRPARVHTLRPCQGAFTSAIASKKGLFEVADKGTLFLDEIGTMGMETQAKLLRVLQEKKLCTSAAYRKSQLTCASWPPPTSTYASK